ncbi:MAG: hypothetical protein CL484_12100 [Acidobacteria bacterium]|nr:hypothetical protein [Acidobacteriota bacterium]|tara:strand:+ start:4215 stop:4937 length:723 start_codon:yes stop_codon:yes gene_type:complete
MEDSNNIEPTTAAPEAPSLPDNVRGQFDQLMQNEDFKKFYEYSTTPQPRVEPETPQHSGVSPEVAAILDRMFPKPQDISIGDPSQQLTAQQLMDYQRQVDQRTRLMNFQNDMKGFFNQPFTRNGVSVDVSDPAQVNGMLNFTRDFVGRSPTSEEIATLYFLDQLMGGAGDSAAKRAEKALQSRAANQQVTQEQPRVVTPKAQPQNRSNNSGRVPTLSEMVAERRGADWVKNWKQRILVSD